MLRLPGLLPKPVTWVRVAAAWAGSIVTANPAKAIAIPVRTETIQRERVVMAGR
jgi:hypothetical protein